MKHGRGGKVMKSGGVVYLFRTDFTFLFQSPEKQERENAMLPKQRNHPCLGNMYNVNAAKQGKNKKTAHSPRKIQKNTHIKEEKKKKKKKKKQQNATTAHHAPLVAIE